MNLIQLSFPAILFIRIVSAQINPAQALITHIEGKVYLDEKVVQKPAVLNETGVVRTEGGRAEIRLRGGTLFLGDHSAVRVIGNRPYNHNRVEMMNGSAVITTDKDGGGSVVCEDTVTLSDSGVFRLDLNTTPGADGCRFRVFDGAASVQLASVATVLRTGQTMVLNRQCGDMIPRNDFNIVDTDFLDLWSRQKRN